jgi:iron-sulfur cluster assembly protein
MPENFGRWSRRGGGAAPSFAPLLRTSSGWKAEVISRRRGKSMLYKGGRRFLAVSEDFMANPQFAVLSLTEAAAARARNLIASAGRPVAGLRVGIKVGGCAGMTYTMDLAEEVRPDDEIIEDQGVKILIAPKDLMFLLGTKLDFETTTLQASFTFQNPNQTGACGCGESVSITPAGDVREKAV